MSIACVWCASTSAGTRAFHIRKYDQGKVMFADTTAILQCTVQGVIKKCSETDFFYSAVGTLRDTPVCRVVS